MVRAEINFQELYGELYDELLELNTQMLQTNATQLLHGLALEQKRVLERSDEKFLAAHREVVQFEKEMKRRFPEKRGLKCTL